MKKIERLESYYNKVGLLEQIWCYICFHLMGKMPGWSPLWFIGNIPHCGAWWWKGSIIIFKHKINFVDHKGWEII